VKNFYLKSTEDKKLGKIIEVYSGVPSKGSEDESNTQKKTEYTFHLVFPSGVKKIIPFHLIYDEISEEEIQNWISEMSSNFEFSVTSTTYSEMNQIVQLLTEFEEKKLEITSN
jgi:hypothetical protein